MITADTFCNYSFAYLGNICIRNFTIQLEESPDVFTRLEGEYYLSNETQEGRSTWSNRNDPNKIWFYRINSENISGTIEYTYNWVLFDHGDGVACAPGYVDLSLMLLFNHHSYHRFQHI